MKRIYMLTLTLLILALAAGSLYADSKKTWSTIGKGLAIYEGAKVLLGREGNIVDDVTGGMKPRRDSRETVSSQEPEAGSYESGYNAGYRKGYEEGYNAGFRNGVDQSSK